MNGKLKIAVLSCFSVIIYFTRDLFLKFDELSSKTISSNIGIVSKIFEPKNSPSSGKIITQINNYGLSKQQIDSLAKQTTPILLHL